VLSAPPPNDLVALLAGARAFVGNDAGPSHLAALLGTPTVAVFGPTSASVWRPQGPDVQVVQGDPSGAASNWRVPSSVVCAAALAAAVHDRQCADEQ
jgi:hypothetical protein